MTRPSVAESEIGWSVPPDLAGLNLTDVIATSGRLRSVSHRRRNRVLTRLAIVIAISMAHVIWAYHIASEYGSLATSYAYFWVGMGLLFGYLFYDSVRTEWRGYPELNVLIAAIASAVPRIVRSPTAFYMNDEFGHVLQVGRLYETGKLFLSNPLVYEASHYPGLSTLAVGLKNATHLELIAIALPLIVLWHVASVTGVYQLGTLVTGDKRVAFGAALIYAINPQMGQVDSWFVYEAFAIPLCIWALVFALSAQRAKGGEQRLLWALVALCGLTCVVTHHATGGLLVVAMALIAVGSLRKGRRREAVAPFIAACAIGAVFVLWAEWRGADLQHYFGPYVSDGYHSLLRRITGKTYTSVHGASAANGRTPFSGASLIPAYERLSSVLMELILLAGTVLVTLFWRSRLTAGRVLVLTLAWLNFALLPLLISAEGQQIAHRTWDFTWIGLSVVAALAARELSTLWQRVRRGHRRDFSGPTLRMAGCIAVVVILIGSYGAGVDYVDMFPGPFMFQSDGRDVPRELVDVADWLNQHGGHNATFASDYRTSVLISGYTLGTPEPLLAMEIIQPARTVPADVVALARRSLQFVIVDVRITTDPVQGNYFGSFDAVGPQPLPSSSVTKLYSLNWLHLVHRTPHYLVFSVAGPK